MRMGRLMGELHMASLYQLISCGEPYSLKTKTGRPRCDRAKNQQAKQARKRNR